MINLDSYVGTALDFSQFSPRLIPIQCNDIFMNDNLQNFAASTFFDEI